MANLLNNYQQDIITDKHYFDYINIYAKSHYRKKEDGTTVSWVDENIDPFTGEWLSRKILKAWGWREDKSGVERGKDYNHSTFNDLIINGLVGVRPQEDGTLKINPLVPKDEWDYFCLDQLSYGGKKITIIYDKDGTRYGKGSGLKLYVDNEEVGSSEELEEISVAF